VHGFGYSFLTFLTLGALVFLLFLRVGYAVAFELGFSASDYSKSPIWTFISSLSDSESLSESAWTASSIPACDFKAIA